MLGITDLRGEPHLHRARQSTNINTRHQVISLYNLTKLFYYLLSFFYLLNHPPSSRPPATIILSETGPGPLALIQHTFALQIAINIGGRGQIKTTTLSTVTTTQTPHPPHSPNDILQQRDFFVFIKL